MGRPKKNNADYYPHFTTMRNHKKVKILRNRFGSVLGYAFWSMMLEWLAEQDGLEWEYSDIEIEMFASELGVSAAEIPQMVDFCVQIELLFKNSDGFLYSESLNDNLQFLFEKRNREREKSKTRERRSNGRFNTTSDGVSAAEIPQSKVKYSKVNNINISVPDDQGNLPAKRKSKIFVPPTQAEVEKYFQENGYDPAYGAKAWNGYQVADWHDSQGKPVKNWKQKMNNNWFREEYKIKSITTKMMY